MNVYMFELRRTWKSAALWTAILLAAMILLMAAVYPVYYESRSEIVSLLSNFPPEFLAAFGMAVDDIFSYGGFLSFSFMYLTLLGGIMAALLGIDAFSREKRTRCVDFLLTKPSPRGRLFAAKLLAVITLITAANILYIAASLLVYRNLGQNAALAGRAVLAASALFFTQLVILGASVFIAVYVKKIRSVSGFSMALGFGGFLLSVLHSLLKEDALRYVAPYKFFDVSKALSEGRFESSYVVTAAVITLIFFILAYLRYCSGEAHAV